MYVEYFCLFFFFVVFFFWVFFFFQAEDGIRDRDVTGVQSVLFRSSLTYVVALARGCSPWIPAAVMSTAGGEIVRSRRFSRRRGCTPNPREVQGLCQPSIPVS